MDHCAVAYEQNICTDESEWMLQWFNSQCLNQTMPMQPDLLPLHDHEDGSSNNSFPNWEFYNNNTDPCNLYRSNPIINCSLLPPCNNNNNIGYERLQQGMGLGCMPDHDPHSMSYLDVDVNQQCEISRVVFTDGVVETENNYVLQLKEKRKLHLEINCSSQKLEKLEKDKEKETNDDTQCAISNNVPRKKSRPSVVRAPTRAKTSKEEISSNANGESSSCSSEDELNGESNANCNSNSKSSKASRGSSTDSQSLYARKRREKINQRLRILQNLVPNGTKVDISTMLEEAVQYVKFMQMQIKLLSSDDLWMYAPLAYNGVNINIDLSRCQ